MKKKYIIISIIFIILLAVDMLTKYFFTDVYNLVIIKNIVSFYYKENTGASFSMLEGHTYLLTILSSLLIVAIVLFDIFHKSKNKLYTLSFALILTGAIGNLIDRVIFGYVRDFIRLDFVNFAIFNIADSCLTIGAILFCIYIMFFTQSKKSFAKGN